MFTKIRVILTKLGYKCRDIFGAPGEPRPLEISAPFNFQEGPVMNFPGYSQDDISLMKEKAIASTAITDDGGSQIFGSTYQRPQSRPSSYSCGFGGRVAYHARKVSRGYLH